MGNIEFDEAQVGLINSGGMIGSFLGLLAMPHVAKAGAPNAIPYSVTFVGATTLGLLGGGVLGRTLDMTWGEVLLCDLAGVLGGIGGAGVALAASGGNELGLTLPPAVGVVGGYGVGLALVHTWRSSRGAPVLRNAPTLRPMASAAFDGERAVPTFGIAGVL